MTKWKGNDLVLAENPRSGKLVLGPDERSMHLHAVGATGAGKSRYLEYLARQDIKIWRHSEWRKFHEDRGSAFKITFTGGE